MRAIGKNIRDIREQRKMTQDELANHLFVTRQTVSNYENGRTQPDIDTLMKLSEIFEVDVHVLLYGQPKTRIQQKMLRRLYIGGACIVLLIVGNFLLSDWAMHHQQLTYDVIPTFFLYILYRPVLFALLGWTILQALGTFTALQPFQARPARYVRWSILVITALFFVITLMLPLAAMFPISLPIFWQRTAYFLLQALPVQHGIPWYLAAACAFGGLWWMTGRRTQPEEM